jgi:hypothetical protein
MINPNLGVGNASIVPSVDSIYSARAASPEGLIKTREKGKNSPLIDHFPLDRNLASLFLNKFLTADFASDPQSLIGLLPQLSEERKVYLKQFLYTPRKLKIHGLKDPISLSIADLFKFCQGEKRIVGGFAKYILSSAWFMKIAGNLRLPDTQSEYFKKILNEIDSEEIDIDLQHINSTIEREVLYIKFVQYLAKCALPPKATEQQQAAKFQTILKGDSFKTVSTFFCVDNEGEGKVVGDANRIPLAFHDLNPVDFSVGSVITKAYLSSVQDLYLRIDFFLDGSSSEIIPTGELHKGWKAILDCLCKTYHIEKWDILAWSRAIYYNTSMGRHPSKIPNHLYDAVKKKCQVEQRTAKTLAFYVNLIARHNKQSEHLLLLAYNAAVDLSSHGFSAQEIREFCVHLLRDEKYTGVAQTLKHALTTLPIEVTASCIELIGILKLASRNHSKLFLTQHNGVPSLMTFIGERTLLQAINPEKALNALSQYSFNQDALALIDQLCVHFGLKEEFKRDFDSPIDSYQYLLNWDWEKLTLKVLALLNKSPELNLIATRFWTLCTGFIARPQGDQHEIISRVLGNWTPLERLNGLHLWDLFSRDFSDRQRFDSARDLLQLAPHPSLSMHLFDDLLNHECDRGALPELLNRMSKSSAMRTGEYVREFFKRILIVKNMSPSNKILCLNFFQNWVVENKLVSILTLATVDKVLDIDKDTADIWLKMVERLCNDEDFEQAAELWKKGLDQGLWEFLTFQKAHRRFMVNFISYLYAQGNSLDQSIGNSLLERIPPSNGKDKLNAEIHELQRKRDKKLEEATVNQRSLQGNIAVFEKALKDSQDPANKLWDSAEEIFAELTQIHPVHQVNVENLTQAKLLLSNPNLISLYSHQRALYQHHLTNLIERCERMSRSDRSIYPILSSLFDLFLRECPSQLPENLYSAFLAYLKREDQGMRPEVIRNVQAILIQLQQRGRVGDVCQLLSWMVSTPVPSSNIEISFWLLEEIFRDRHRSPYFLNVVEYMSTYTAQGFIPPTYRTSDQIHYYSAIAEHFLNSDQLRMALPWITRVLVLVVSGGPQQQEIHKKLLDWCTHVTEDPDAVLKFIEATSAAHPALSEEIWKTFEQSPESLVNKNPKLYLNLLSKRDVRVISRASYGRIYRVFQSILEENDASKENLSICLGYYENSNIYHNLPFNFVLKSVLKINDTPLKIRALSIQMVRVSLVKLGTFLEDREKMIDWVRSILTMVRLIDQLKSNVESVDLAKIYCTLTSLLFDVNMKRIDGQNVQVADFSEQSSTIKRIFERHRLHEIPQVITAVLRSATEALPLLEQQGKRYLRVVSHIIEIYDSHRDLLQPQNIRKTFRKQFLNTLGKSPIACTFYAGFTAVIDDLLSEDPDFSKEEIADLLSLYFHDLDRFAEHSKIMTVVNKSLWDIGLKIPPPVQRRFHDALVKIFPKIPYPGRYLLPTDVLKNHDNGTYYWDKLQTHIRSYAWGYVGIIALYFLKQGKLTLTDFAVWFCMFVVLDKILFPGGFPMLNFRVTNPERKLFNPG